MIWTPEAIKALRQRLKLSPDEFGKRLGYQSGARVRVHELETGKRKAHGPLVVALDCLDKHTK